MTTARGTSLSSPAWGARPIRRTPPALAPLRADPAPPAAPRSGQAPFSTPRRPGVARGAIVLVLGWILLWAYFVVAVAEQAAALRSTVERGGGAASAEPAGAQQPPLTARVRRL
ncbi:hypothetical protein [Anaeromyxobacter oryzae]|uniref:Uncharacterized protein n=1 Tax=Anaeromyxobacter oryzae TaxID=2918170 RepID=A0ABM7X0W0_9BACT|nr:hypothetical protein [Anaeromyxobacter oryzae]BDG05437.1 hypothetical protein AMOR_44330 [Anaeromyxobacter oryzae]